MASKIREAIIGLFFSGFVFAVAAFAISTVGRVSL